MAKSNILKRLQALQREKEANAANKRLSELFVQLYEMDVDSMEYDVQKGYKTRADADKELARRYNKYFG